MTECVCPFACTKSRRYMAIDSKFPLFCICVCPSFARMWNLILILFDSLVLILVHLSFPCDPKAKRIRLYAFVEPHFWENPFRSFYYEKKMSQKALKLKRLTKSKRTILISIWIRSHRNIKKNDHHFQDLSQSIGRVCSHSILFRFRELIHGIFIEIGTIIRRFRKPIVQNQE